MTPSGKSSQDFVSQSEAQDQLSREMVSLRDHFGALLNSQRDYFESRLDALNEATRVRADTIEKRFESVNEFRSTLTDQAAKFITRESVELMCNELRKDISDLKKSRDQMSGKASQSAVNVAYVITAISIILTIIGIIMRQI